MDIKTKKLFKKILFLVLPLSFFMIITLAPFYWILITALKTSTEVFAKPLTYWPRNITYDNFINLFQKLHFERYFLNSFIVSVSVTALVSVMALIGGYAMSRYKFKGKTFVYILLLCTQMFPAVVLMIPLFQTMNQLKLINDLRSLIIVCSCTNLPYCMFMMMGYYNAIPRTLEEAAQVDGCNLLQAVFKILLPAMKPSIVATGAYAFINSWNVYVYATAFITRKEKYTIPLALSIFQGEANTNYGGIAAACVFALVPALLLFAFIQKNLAGGSTSGAVKG
ncbi:carbohydrate ABC transporter permease [Lacrimispora indolis]|uniref:carbohydrate ABC transporter permease n=1 Tax=Lacrimispora indolis TaxID=69825 RepID=UPI0004115AD7|nr:MULTISPECIES: carbohydrate ABC transporter permease [Lachnospiraceae]MBE7722097.1 carbohydrate ABC transporter permease [Lacrimispora celerecrescens]